MPPLRIRVQILAGGQGCHMALSHRLGHLEGRAGAVAGGKDAGEICGHPAVHLNYPVLCLQVREQSSGATAFRRINTPAQGSRAPSASSAVTVCSPLTASLEAFI